MCKCLTSIEAENLNFEQALAVGPLSVAACSSCSSVDGREPWHLCMTAHSAAFFDMCLRGLLLLKLLLGSSRHHFLGVITAGFTHLLQVAPDTSAVLRQQVPLFPSHPGPFTPSHLPSFRIRLSMCTLYSYIVKTFVFMKFFLEIL